MRIVSLAERKRREAERRREAVCLALSRMADYARRKKGRFLVFGSAARGEVRYDSDLDILVDFPPDREADAWTFVEELGSEVSVPFDIQSRVGADPRLIDRIESELVVLG